MNDDVDEKRSCGCWRFHRSHDLAGIEVGKRDHGAIGETVGIFYRRSHLGKSLGGASLLKLGRCARHIKGAYAGCRNDRLRWEWLRQTSQSTSLVGS